MKSLVVDEDFPAQLMSSFDTGDREVVLPLTADTLHRLRVTYQDDRLVNPAIQLSVAKTAELEELSEGKRRIWIPSGVWRDLWSGRMYEGPATLDLPVTLHQLPALARSGAILPLGPISENTGRAVWETLSWEIFVPEDEKGRNFVLYEDDGESRSYLNGQWARSTIAVQRTDREVLVRLEEPRGEYAASIARRRCLLRIHLLPGDVTMGVRIGEAEMMETPSAPAAGFDNSWWRRLPAVGASERSTPLSLSDYDPGYPGSESTLVSIAPGVAEVRIRFKEA